MKRVVFAFLILWALAAVEPCAYAYTYGAYVTDGVVKATPVVVSDSSDEAVTALTAGESVKASVLVKPGSSSTGSAEVCLILATYAGGVLDELTCKKQTVSSEVEIKTDYLTVPSGSNPGVRVYLWDGDLSAQPLAAVGTVGAASAVQQILVGGTAVEDFSSDTYEYDVTVSAGYTDWPDIVVLTDNLASGVGISRAGKFPLSKNSSTVFKRRRPGGGYERNCRRRNHGGGAGLYASYHAGDSADYRYSG